MNRFESIVKFELSSSLDTTKLGLTMFESIVKFELSSSLKSCDNAIFLFESIVKFELSSSHYSLLPMCGRLRVLLNLNYLHQYGSKTFRPHCLRVLLNLNYLHPIGIKVSESDV